MWTPVLIPEKRGTGSLSTSFPTTVDGLAGLSGSPQKTFDWGLRYWFSEIVRCRNLSRWDCVFLVLPHLTIHPDFFITRF